MLQFRYIKETGKLAYEVNWLPGHEGRVIIERLTGVFAVEDLEKIVEAANALMSQGQKPVHLIIDTSGITKHPNSLTALRNAAPGGQHENLGWTLMISSSMLMSTMTKVITQLMRLEFRSFTSLEAALAFLKLQDPTLEEA
jgi:spore maturation protein SpmA